MRVLKDLPLPGIPKQPSWSVSLEPLHTSLASLPPTVDCEYTSAADQIHSVEAAHSSARPRGRNDMHDRSETKHSGLHRSQSRGECVCCTTVVMSTAIAFMSNGWLCLDSFQRTGKALAGASGLRFTTLRASRNWGKTLTVIGFGSPHHDHSDPVGPRGFHIVLCASQMSADLNICHCSQTRKRASWVYAQILATD